MDNPRQRCVALDGLRGLAAVAVVLHHCGHHLRAPWLVGHGAFAVDVFFVMSGFVLHRAYGPRLRGGWPVAAFARARLARLYPMYAVGLVVGLLVLSAYAAETGLAGAGSALFRAFIGGSLLVPDLSDPDGQVFVLNAPSWSLLVEVVVSAAYALGARYVRARGLAVLAALAAAGLAAAAFAGQPLLAGGAAASLGVNLLRGGFGFAAGITVAAVEERGGFGAVAPCPSLLAFGVLTALMFVPSGALGPAFDLFGIVVAAPLIVGLAAAGRPPRRAGRWCETGGSLSYPLYTLHAPLLFSAAAIGVPRWGGSPGTAFAVMLAVTGGCAVLAWAVGLWVEPRLIGAMRNALPSAARGPARGGRVEA